jgi:predicted DsbA family dithiol-disulfide isomerase
VRIDIWSDVICPWCYLGLRHLRDALSPYDGDVDIVHHAFELDPTRPRENPMLTVKALSQKFGMTPEQAIDAQRQMTARAAKSGLEFNLDGQRSGNTRDAHRLLSLALDHDVQEALLERLYRAHFTEQRSIFDHDSLAALAVAAGLDEPEVSATLSTSAYDERVETDEEQARMLGINGVPFFIFDRRYAVSGAQPAEVLRQVLDQARAEAS